LARLFADENFPNPTVEGLRRLGHDVLTVAEAGLAGLGIPDEEVLAFAHADGRAVLTHNRKHFRNLHKAGQPHSGMVLCTEETDFDSLAIQVNQALLKFIDLTGQVIRVAKAQRYADGASGFSSSRSFASNPSWPSFIAASRPR
jgi:predicted nuclease of predicted toxin-antitoxin system